MKSKDSFRLGQIRLNARSLGQFCKNLVYIVEGTVLIQSLRNFVRMFIYIKSKSCLKLGYVMLKTRSLGQIVEKA